MKLTMRIRSKWHDTRLYNWAYDIYLIKAYDWPTSKLFRKIRLGLRIAYHVPRNMIIAFFTYLKNAKTWEEVKQVVNYVKTTAYQTELNERLNDSEAKNAESLARAKVREYMAKERLIKSEAEAKISVAEIEIASKQAEVEIEAAKKLTAEQFIDYKSEERARESEHEKNELEHEKNELEHKKESHSFMVKVIGFASACITIVGSTILIIFKDELSKLIFG